MVMKARASRVLRLTSPLMRGEDVRRLQIGLNARLRARGRQPILVDGQYGRSTAQAVRTVLWFLGCASKNLDQGATRGYQTIIRNPKLRPPAWYRTANDRTRWLATRHKERDAMLAWCRSKIGMTETPADSNRGPQVDVWERECGMLAGPWCAMFLIYGLRHIAGFAAPSSWRYTPQILADAQIGKYGTRLLKNPEPGCLVLYDFEPGGDPVMHVGIYEGAGKTIEGNTSSGDAGSQDNGGGVFRRERHGQFVVGYVHIPYGS